MDDEHESDEPTGATVEGSAPVAPVTPGPPDFMVAPGSTYTGAGGWTWRLHRLHLLHLLHRLPHRFLARPGAPTPVPAAGPGDSTSSTACPTVSRRAREHLHRCRRLDLGASTASTRATGSSGWRGAMGRLLWAVLGCVAGTAAEEVSGSYCLVCRGVARDRRGGRIRHRSGCLAIAFDNHLAAVGELALPGLPVRLGNLAVRLGNLAVRLGNLAVRLGNLAVRLGIVGLDLDGTRRALGPVGDRRAGRPWHRGYQHHPQLLPRGGGRHGDRPHFLR